MDAPTTTATAGMRQLWAGQTLAHRLLGAGLAWVMLGMLVMPAGVSLNPSRAFQLSLLLLLYLPALWAIATHGRLIRQQLWPQWSFRVFVLLLGWALLSLGWAGLKRPAEEVGRVLSAALFALGWFVWAAPDGRRGLLLLRCIGIGMALCALAFGGPFLLHYHAGDRIDGEGVVANANYAAAAMGVACVWMMQLPPLSRGWNVARWLALLPLLGFVAMSDTRSVWLGLAACLVLAPLWNRRRAARVLALLTALGALALVLLLPDPLGARGLSLRPQIFAHALDMIRVHPWLGLGQGAPFRFTVNGEQFTHSHNLFTQAAIELGLPGLLLTLCLWLLIGWQGWCWRSHAQGRLLLALWVFASVVLQFDMPQLLDSPRPGWLLIWLPFALALGLGARDGRDPAQPLPLH